MKRIGKHVGSMLMVFLASPAIAADVSVSMTADDVTNWSNASVAFGRCISDLQLRSDLTVCRGLAQWLDAQSGKVALAARIAQSAPQQPTVLSAPTPIPVQPSAPVATPAPATGHPPAAPPAAPPPDASRRPVLND